MPIKFRHHYSPHRKSNTSKSIQKLVFGLLMIFLVTTAVRHSRATTINTPTQPSQSTTAKASTAPASTATNSNDTWKLSYFHHDHLGNITAVTDDHGNLIEIKDYLPFGGTNVNEQYGDYASDYAYNDKEKDDESNLYYYGARYYNAATGKFTSIDPALLANEYLVSILTNPQLLNSYFYAANNPQRFIDPNGLWNIETGEVEKGDTLSSITEKINEIYKTSYDYLDIARLNNVENSDKINVGQIIIPNAKIPDVSYDLTEKMQNYSEQADHRGPWFFKDKFKTKGDWDIKNQPGLYNIKDHPEGFVFFGTKIRSDAPGNILYGFVGKATVWATEKLLLKKAGEYQIKSGTSRHEWQNNTYYGDDPVDQVYIKMGFQLYEITGNKIHDIYILINEYNE